MKCNKRGAQTPQNATTSGSLVALEKKKAPYKWGRCVYQMSMPINARNRINVQI